MQREIFAVFGWATSAAELETNGDNTIATKVSSPVVLHATRPCTSKKITTMLNLQPLSTTFAKVIQEVNPSIQIRRITQPSTIRCQQKSRAGIDLVCVILE